MVFEDNIHVVLEIEDDDIFLEIEDDDIVLGIEKT